MQRRQTDEQVKRLVRVNLEPKFGKQVLAKVGTSGVGMFEYMSEVFAQLERFERVLDFGTLAETLHRVRLAGFA